MQKKIGLCILSLLQKSRNPILEFSQIMMRGVLVFIAWEIISGILSRRIFHYEDPLAWFIAFYAIQYIVELQYFFLHIKHNLWQNPFSPELGNHFILKNSRKILYFILRVMVYIEWYFAMLIPVLWFIKNIDGLLGYPLGSIDYTICFLGMVITFLCNYVGRNVMKRRYFANDKDGLKNEDSLNEGIIPEKNVATRKKVYFNLLQIICRGLAVAAWFSMIEFFIKVASYGDKTFLKLSYWSDFIFITVIFLSVELLYERLHSGLNLWSNPMSPVVANDFFSKRMKGSFYLILRIFVYFEKYLFRYIPYFWLAICIYKYMSMGPFMDFTSFSVRTVTLFIVSYVGGKILNKHYFSEEK